MALQSKSKCVEKIVAATTFKFIARSFKYTFYIHLVIPFNSLSYVAIQD